ncbi:MAG TPA: TetR/AcrR family transcriptional regulator [Myxococcota bacterium]|nr:TetR/AcrR family transcriptional regulator [Myxococcota bacterium]
MSSGTVGELSGRPSRMALSRVAICEACLDLVQEGALQPSADQIAERAGVSRRSIFNHFADLAELYDAVVEVGLKRCAPLLEEISAHEPIARRVDHLAEVRSKFLEATAAFTRALTAQALVGPSTGQALRVSKYALRLQHQDVERLFHRELAGLSPPERAEVLEAMSAAMAPVLWEHLRRGRGNSLSSARGVMKRTLTAILRDAGVLP